MKFLPAAPPLGQFFILGSGVLLAGLLLFNAPLWVPAAMRQLKAWTADGGGSAGGGSAQQLATGLK